jgi:hypothetical protein
MQTPPDVFFHFTATGWTAIGSIVGAASRMPAGVLGLWNETRHKFVSIVACGISVL